MCGIIGIAGKSPVVNTLYDALCLLQHRGQDAAGIATICNGQLKRRKACGLVRDVFAKKHIQRLSGNVGIGHVRYPTAGTDNAAEAQPLYVNSPFGIVLAHNGNVVNADELHREMYEADLRHINTSSDSEILLNVLAHEIHSRVKTNELSPTQLFNSIDALMDRADGGYAVVGRIMGQGFFAFRDPNGIRPLILGKKQTGNGAEYAVASESVALTGIGFTDLWDFEAGEAIMVDTDGVLHRHLSDHAGKHTPCIFEYVYMARPDSVIDGASVYQTRKAMGHQLGDLIKEQHWVDEIDVVISIPDTGRTPALEVAKRLDKEYREGFVKNRYIGRTFIMPGQELREKSVREKLSPMAAEFKDMNVLLVDDSIVRGTTSRQIVQMVRDAGAKKVFFASAAPPITHVNVYGIDMPDVDELIAHGRTLEQMRDKIGADELIFQTETGLRSAVRSCQPSTTDFEDSCFTGEYITGGIDDKYLANLKRRRNN
jgi:amidophosphoribosyltransferase